MNSKDKKTTLMEQIAYINECYDNGDFISLEDMKETLLLIKSDSKENERISFFNVSRLDIKHNCYDVLQAGFKIIYNEIGFISDDITLENFTIILGQYITLKSLQDYLQYEKEIPINILSEMSNRTVKIFDESTKVFKKANNIGKY